jgi:hypothetical protein
LKTGGGSSSDTYLLRSLLSLVDAFKADLQLLRPTQVSWRVQLTEDEGICWGVIRSRHVTRHIL